MASLAIPASVGNMDVVSIVAAEEIAWDDLDTIFPDSRVSAAVKKSLGYKGFSEGDTLTQDDLNLITNISLEEDDNGELDLTNIDRLANLQVLYITGDVKSLEPIKKLSKIYKLQISQNSNITSFEDISDITTLENISLSSCNSLESLDGLEKNTGMKYIDMYCCYALTDINACTNFSDLEMAVFYGCSALEDISPLKDSNNLTEVDLYNAPVEDISALKDKTTITILNIGNTNTIKNNKDSTYEVLKSLTSVTRLGVRSAYVDDEAFEVICNMTNLKSLDLYDNDVSDISSITKLTNLSTVDISGNEICDFSPLSSLTNLKGHTVSVSGVSRQSIDIQGCERTITNPFVGMDGNPVIPLESDRWVYNAEDNTITFTGKNYTSEKIAVANMNYNGNEFEMELKITIRGMKDTITITKEPQSVSCTEGDKVTLTVEAESDDENFTYVWYKGETIIAGATTATLTIDNAELTDAGTYKCVISNATSSVTSDSVTVTVEEKEDVITITTQPKSVTCTEGDKVTLTVEAESDDENFTYVWYKGETIIADATTATLTIDNAELTDAGTYKCVISNATSSVTSDSVTVTVEEKEDVITITKEPQSVSCTEGDKVTLTVEAESDDENFTYVWYKGETIIAGATTATLAIDNAELTDAGTYKCVISNATSSVTSNSATVTVEEKEDVITITTQPKSVTCTEGDKVTLTVEAESDDENFTYKWYKGEDVIADATTATLAIDNAKLTDAGTYKCVISNATSSVTSNSATVTVEEKATTEEPTTEEPTTEEPTTEEPTTEEPTTEEPTTEEVTTEETKVEPPTTEESKVEEPTTENKVEDAPNTGDSNIFVVFVAMILSLAGIVITKKKPE